MFTILGYKKKYRQNATGCNFRGNNLNETMLEAFCSSKSLVYGDIFINNIYLFFKALDEYVSGAATSTNILNESRYCLVDLYCVNEKLYANSFNIVNIESTNLAL